jgi:hypothetical protein
MSYVYKSVFPAIKITQLSFVLFSQISFFHCALTLIMGCLIHIIICSDYTNNLDYTIEQIIIKKQKLSEYDRSLG